MNESHIPQSELDKLVDGELTTEQYRVLLQTLDSTPDGWKRCATAFLEAQVWEADFAELPPALKSETVPAAPLALGFRVSQVLNLAAAVLLAFGLGAIAHNWYQGRQTQSETFGGLAEHQPAEPSQDSLATTEPQLAAEPESPAADATRPALGNVELLMTAEDGTTNRRRLPFYKLRDVPAHALVGSDVHPPADVQSALDRLGLRFQRQRVFKPLLLEDGRRMVVPVEHVEIVPVSGPTY